MTSIIGEFGKLREKLRVFGDYDESYQAFPKWTNILKLTNPRTKIVWKAIPLRGILRTCVLCVFFEHLGQVLKALSIVDQLYKLMVHSYMEKR